MLTSSQSSDLVILCFSVFWRSTLLHEVLWFCTRDVLSQKWPSSYPPSPATFRNLLVHFHPAEGFLFKNTTGVKNVKKPTGTYCISPFFLWASCKCGPFCYCIFFFFFEVVIEHWFTFSAINYQGKTTYILI